MKIKSLLLDSAAAMFAVSGASAADAIVAAEPEPVEYVRVCDAFGNGYFYIPGTETCLRLSGYVWFQLGGSTGDDSWENGNTSTRARLDIDARSDTEWGELASRIRLQGTWNRNADGPGLSAIQVAGTGGITGTSNVIDQAWLRLGGLFMGYSESYWANAYNTGASNWGSHSWDGMGYGYQQRHLVGYTYNNGTFFIAVSAEDDDDSTNWTPDFTGKIGAVFGGATIWLKAGYDETNAVSGVSGTGVGAGVALDLGPGNLRVLGYWADGLTAYSATTRLGQAPEWSVLASYGMDLGTNLYGSIGAQWFNDFYCPPGIAGCATNESSGQDAWAAEAELVWTPVTNFEIRAWIAYTNVDSGPIYDGGDFTTGFVRFQRSF